MPKKKGYDHRLLACVQRGKCVEGIDLPVINPAQNVTEGRIDARRKTRRKSAKKKDEREQDRVSDEQLVELYLQRRKLEKEKSNGSDLVKFPGDEEKSIEVALTRLRNKARLREINKLGAELEDIKDRMVNVLDEYDDLLSVSPYTGPMDMEISRILEIDGLDKWRSSVKDLIHGYANRCSQREEVLEDVYQNVPSDDEEEKAPSIVEDDIEEVERTGAEISENLQNVQVKARKLNFLHYTILKSSAGVNTHDLGLKAHRELDLQKKVVDRFKNFIKVSNERKTRVNAWKYAAEEIVGLLKSVREEGTFKMHEVEKSFNKLLSAFNSQSEQLEVAKVDLRKQRQIATIAKQEKDQIQSDNMLLQDQVESTKRQLKASEQTAKRLENRLYAHLADIDDEELYKPIPADDEERKEFVFIQRTRKIKARVDELEKENTRLQSDNKSLQESLEEANKAAEELTKEPEVKIVEVVQDSCQNCTVLQENFRDISEELALEKDRVASLENDLAESQAQIQKFNQELVQLKQQNSRLLLMTQKVESTHESTISLQSSQSMLSAQPSFCPPEVSNDQLSSADESGYTSHEISTLELKNFRKRLSRVEERRNSVIDCSTQTTEEIPNAVFDKAIQAETDAQPLVNTKVNTEQQENIKDLSRMIKQKAFDEDFTEALDKQVEMICHNIVCLTGLASAITPRPSSDVSLSLPKLTADLEQTDSDRTKVRQTRFETTSYKDINVENADAGKDNWDTAAFEEENLETTNLDKSESESTNLDEPHLRTTNFHETDREEINSEEELHSEKTNLETTDLEKTNLVTINFEEANLGIADSEKKTVETTELEQTNLEKESSANEEIKSKRAENQEPNTDLAGEIQSREFSLPVPHENIKAKLSIVNLTLESEDERKQDGGQIAESNQTKNLLTSTNVDAPASIHIDEDITSAKTDFEPMHLKESLAALRDELKQLHDKNGIDLENFIDDSGNDRSESTFDHWKPKLGINKASEAAYVVYSLKHFAEKSWKKFDAGVRKILDEEDVSDEHKVNEHVKLMAKHAFKILQVIGVSISEMSQFHKRSNLKRDTSLPLIKIDAESKHSGAKLITEKSGIWLPMISTNSSEGPVLDYTSEELEKASTDGGTKVTEVKKREQKNKQPSLPLIKDKRTEPPKRPKNFLGIGGHQLMASKSQSDNIHERPLPDNQRQRATAPERRQSAVPQNKTNFRTSRILGKNRKLVALLSKSGKSMQEINSILGLNQASFEEQPMSLANGVNQLPSSQLGLSSKPIALPKLTEEGSAKHDKQTLKTKENHQLADLKGAFSATTIIPIELPTQKSGILAMGSSYGHGQHATIGPAFTLSVGNGVSNAESSISMKNVPDKAPEKRRLSHRFQPRRLSHRTGYSAEKKKMLQPFKITGSGGMHAKGDSTFEFPNVKRKSVSGHHNTNSIKESLFEQRKQRRVSYSVHHQGQSKLQLPQLAIKRGL